MDRHTVATAMRMCLARGLRGAGRLLVAIVVAAAAAVPGWSAAEETRPAARPDDARAALDRALAAYARGDHARAEQAFGALAARGVPAAIYNLGVMHLRDEAARPDARAGRRLLTQAAEQGFVTAQFALAQGWEAGHFGRVDLPAAQRWYRRAAEAGSVDAQVAMGTAHYLGRGETKDAAQAAHWYREAAKGGDVGAQYLIASMYEQGDGVPRDLRLARYWYEAAARNGDDAAPLKVRELDARMDAARESDKATRPP